MAQILLFENNAASTLAAPITSGATTITLVPGAGALFPNPGSGQVFVATLIDAATGLLNEIVVCTARSGDILTVIRGTDGTTPLSWLAGDDFKMLPTAATMNSFSQVTQTQAGAPNYALDTGAVNAYAATMSPAVVVRTPGLVFRIKAQSSNTGDSTVNIGVGSIQIVNPDGSTLGAGAILNGGVFEGIDLGSGPYQLISANAQAQSAAGGFTTGGMQWRPTSESLTGWVVANATTIGNASSNATQLASAGASAAFAWHWNNFSNTQCPVFTSGGVPTTRGANAAADFAANKQIQVFDMRGTGPMGVDTMGGGATTRLTGVPVTSGNATTPGSIVGENLHTLILSEIPSHQHAVFLKDNTHIHTYVETTFPGGGGPSLVNAAGPTGTTTSVLTSANSSNITIGSVNGTANDNQTAVIGGGGSHNTVQRSALGYWYIKL